MGKRNESLTATLIVAGTAGTGRHGKIPSAQSAGSGELAEKAKPMADTRKDANEQG
jgi:hypothetical protein